ncbi:ROK family glucokinase [Marinicrinis sediminis]|uniref:Glucokinase n=1 Tax=Marinicrinis sediminis TaxID=1652465 RepID=A0ABW5R8B6_9BACL
MMEKIYIGVDLGGTTVKVGICNPAGDLMHKFEGPTGVEHGTEAIIDNIVKYVKELVAESAYSWEQVEGIGAGIPGFMDMESGVVKLSPNLGFRDTPVKQMLEDRLGKQVTINNDANVAALGEAWAGAGKGLKNVVCFTLGTGVGGGIIIDGKIYEGSGMAGELGHMAIIPDLEAIQCNCGQRGCLETVSSATGIIRMAVDAVKRGDRTSLSSLEFITAKDVFDAAKQGDDAAIRIVQRASFYLGKAMVLTSVILNPQRYIIGGGVSKAGDFLFQALREHYKTMAPPTFGDMEIVPAVLGNDAGMIGAAGLNLRS